MLAGLGVEQLDGAGQNVDVLIRLAGLAAAALIDLDDEDGRMHVLDDAQALDDAGAAHVGLDLHAVADHPRQLLLDLRDVIDFHLFHAMASSGAPYRQNAPKIDKRVGV